MPIAPQMRRANAPPIQRPASLTPSSWNAERRTVDVCWTTGARAANILALTGEIIEEELDTRPGAVRLDRLNNGAPVLADHANALGRQIGVVVPGSARIEGGRGYATVQLSDQPAIAPIVADIAAGIIRNVSVGYHTHAWEVTGSAGGGPDVWRAVDWEPMEISFVPIPVDAGAQVRSNPKLHSCVIRTTSRQESAMEDDDIDTIDGGDTAAPPAADTSTRGVRGGGRPATIAQVRAYMALTDQTTHDLTPTERSTSARAYRAAVGSRQAVPGWLRCWSRNRQTLSSAPAEAEVGVRQNQIPILQQRIAEATDKAAAATGRYDRAMDQLNQRFGAGRVSQADYLREATALQNQRDRAVDAANEAEQRGRGGRSGGRSEAAEAAENARSQLALARAYMVGGSPSMPIAPSWPTRCAVGLAMGCRWRRRKARPVALR